MTLLAIRERTTRRLLAYYFLEEGKLRASPNVPPFVIEGYNERGIIDAGARWQPQDGVSFLRRLARVLGSTATEEALMESHERLPAVDAARLDIPRTDPEEYVGQ